MSDGKRLPWILIGSLGTNALLVGALAGVWMTTQRTPEPPPLRLQMADRAMVDERLFMRRLMRALPQEKSRELRRTLATGWVGSRPLRQDIQAAREAMREAFLADPYDVAATREAMERLRTLEAERRAATDAQLSEVLETVPAEARREALERPRRERGLRRGGGGREDE